MLTISIRPGLLSGRRAIKKRSESLPVMTLLSSVSLCWSGKEKSSKVFQRPGIKLELSFAMEPSPKELVACIDVGRNNEKVGFGTQRSTCCQQTGQPPTFRYICL